ncbi:hypothetical protein [Streptomyces sp. NPDC059092]|uniref:hypothetical protein n=1 Tax=Streptomyces sp. NPDC059092 TaxID=3346725 RepID=UPI0036B1DB8F
MRRQIALTLCAGALVALAVVHPVSQENAVDATQFTVAFFATLLTGEAVIFALTFSASSAWPSLRAIDSHIAFREWVLIGWIAAMFTACGILAESAVSTTYGALLFILANVFGVFSFVRLFGLASVGGRNQLLRETLAEALDGLGAHELLEDSVVVAYLGALDQAISSNDPTAIRNLVGQLTTTQRPTSPSDAQQAWAALHAEVLHRLARAALVRGADPVVVVGCAEQLTESMLRRIPGHPDPAVVLGEFSRYLAWLGSASRLMSVRGIASVRAARELVAMSVDCRLRILLAVDPEPKQFSRPDEAGSVIQDPAGALLWARDFAEFHGAHQANSLYSVFQILTGSKFMGNYWDGDSVLGRLRLDLFGDSGRVTGDEADATRALFDDVAAFDRFWALVSVSAIATLRDVRVPHPPELVRPEFTPDSQLLGAYLRSFACHRWFETADAAHEALLGLMSRADSSDAPWELIRRRTSLATLRTPTPRAEPRERPAAMVLAVAGKLAPLELGGSDSELRSFLGSLPAPALHAARGLADRVLPKAAEQSNSIDAIATGFEIMQLVGAHTRE